MTGLRFAAAPAAMKAGYLLGLLLLAWAGAGWLVVTPAALGPVGTPLLPPLSANAWLGTDQIGRSVALQTWFASAHTLAIGGVATAATMFIGICAGCSAAVMPRRSQSAIDVAMNTWQAVPPMLVILAIAMVFPLTGIQQIAAITAACWAGVARITRAEVSELLARPYVLAAQALGASPWHIFWRTLLPNLAPMLKTLTALTAATALTLQSSLAFLGLDSGDISWGSQIGQGQRYVLVAWWVVAPPAACLLLAIGSVMLISTGAAPGAGPRRGLNPAP